MDLKLSLFVLPSKGLKQPELYIAANHSCYPEICDSCDLKGHCAELFGVGGADCKIHSLGYRWQHVPREQAVLLKELLKDI